MSVPLAVEIPEREKGKSMAVFDPDKPFANEGYALIARKPVGYLINFGPVGKLEWKRFVLSQFCP